MELVRQEGHNATMFDWDALAGKAIRANVPFGGNLPVLTNPSLPLNSLPFASESAFLAAIVESSDDAIVSKDLTGRVTSWNHAAERIFGYLAEEMVGNSILKIIPPDRRDEEPRILERISRGERVDHFETIRRRKDGELIQVSVTISPICDETGKIVGASKVARDVTEQRRLQAELQRQSEELRHYADTLALQHQQKDQFMAMLAHELRNPLAPMRTALEILRLKANSPEQVHRVRETLVRQTKNLTRLVDDLLDVSRLTQGKMMHRFERVDLAALVRATCGAYQTEAEASGLTVRCDTPQVPVWVMGDATRLDQVMDNLIENAIKFSERGGRIEVRLSPENERATLVVSDSGIGIVPEMLPHLFDPFTQSDHSLARSRGGLGLGLAIVKGLAELHGGSIEVDSDGVGKGATFRLTLPAIAELPALTEQNPSTSPSANGKKVLIVEDNRDAADSLAELLRLFGYQVSVAYTGPEGVTAASEFHPEVILCDIGLPGLDGYAVAQHLRHDPLTASIRLIAVTGYGSEADRKRSRQAGFDTHLVKPVDPDRLLGELS